MTDKELLEEIEQEFGSHAPTDEANGDDLDAFLADLKNTISSEPQDDSAKKAAPIAPPKKEKPLRSTRKEKVKEEFDSHAPANDANTDDLDSFLADLKNTISTEPQTDSAKKTEPPKKAAPIASQKKEKPQRPAREKKPKAETKKVSQKDVQSEQEAGGLTKFVLCHHTAVNVSLLCICLILVAAIAAVILFQGNSDPLEGKIMENVFIAGTDVGGMTREEAYDAVIDAIGTNYTEGIMNVKLGGSVLVLGPSQTRPVVHVGCGGWGAYGCG